MDPTAAAPDTPAGAGESRTPDPYVAPHERVAEITIKALILGAILSIVMGAANAYLGLKAGMTVSASIPAAVISMALLRGLLPRLGASKATILENNIVQTMASTGESLAAGVIFTVPALVMIGEWQNFEFWPTTLIVLLGGLLGILFMVPMRKALIVDRPDLIYPEGVACSEVLITGEEGGSGVRSISLGVISGAIFKILIDGYQMVQSTVQGAIAKGKSVFYVGSDMSVALFAVGYIVNFQIASQILLGGAIGWWIALPLLGGYEAGMDPVAAADDIWHHQIRYLGVGTMMVGGLWSVWSVRHGIVAGLKSLAGVKSSSDEKKTLRTERNLPLSWLLGLFLLTVFGTFMFYDSLIGSAPISALTTVLMVVTSFIFVAVATYIAGLVGSSNSPVSGMTICALLITAGVLLALGVRSESAILATLGVAGVVCCATCTSGDIAQDLKTGLAVGATPAKQQLTEVIAAVIPAFCFAPILFLLHNSYGIGTGTETSLRAPQAALFASLTKGFFGDEALPWNMIGIGAVIGVALIAVNAILIKSGSSFRTHVMPVAVGIYLPLSLAVPVFLGGVLRALVGRDGRSEARDSGVLFGSGVIAGEALMGIFLAAIIYVTETGPPLKEVVSHPAPSLLIFGAMVALYAWVARRED